MWDIYGIDDIELLSSVADAVKVIKFLGVVITNQPMIARGNVTVPELDLPIEYGNALRC